MNYLAHVFLARHHPDAMLGALLGDFCRPGQEGSYNQTVRREIVMHRRIDAYTDSHPLVLEAKTLFRTETRRFAGIALDVFFDHRLASGWDRYCATPLPDFSQTVYRALRDRQGDLPARLEAAVTPMIAYDWLASYADFAVVEPVLRRIGMRLSRSGELLQASVADLERNYARLEQVFDDYFPELIAFVDAQRRL